MSLNQLRKNRNAKRNDNDNRNENSFAFRFACLVCLSVCVCLSAAFVLIVVRFSAQMLVQSKGENLAPLVEDAKPVEPQPAAVTALASESSASSVVAPAPAEPPPEEKPLGKLTLHHAAVARAHWTEPAAGQSIKPTCIVRSRMRHRRLSRALQPVRRTSRSCSDWSGRSGQARRFMHSKMERSTQR